MAKPKIAVIFYSTYGTNHQIALAASEAAEQAGAEVRLLRVKETAPESVVASQAPWKATAERIQGIPEVTPDDMVWADGYFISAPTRYGVVASQLRVFIDTLGPVWGQGKLANKVFTATTSAQNEHGGQESTLLSLYTTAMHWGSILVPPGYTDPALYEAGGNPYGYSAKAGSFDEKGRVAVAHQAKRLVEFASKLLA
jgi:NAD(P)H dehydrogenase (quinone)